MSQSDPPPERAPATTTPTADRRPRDPRAEDEGETARTPSRPDLYLPADPTAEGPFGAEHAPAEEPPTRRTRSGGLLLDPDRRTHPPARPAPRITRSDAPDAGATVRARGTPPPLPPLGARAGIHDRRDGLQVGPRLKPLDAHTVEVRLSDVDLVSPADPLPAHEPLGAPPALRSAVARMVAFFGPKGGVGCTTLACNVGGVLARNARPTVLVDLDLQLGAVPVSLGLQPQQSISALVEEAERIGSGPLRTELDAHDSGLRIAAQTRIEDLGAVTVKRLPRFFDALGARYSHVLVDGLRDFNDHAVATMDLAHMVVVVITQDVPAVRAGARALRIFRRLGYKNDRLLLVVNRYHRRAPVDLDDIRRVLGVPVHAHVHNDFPLVEQAINRGRLVDELQPRSRPARDLLELSRLVAGDVEPRPDRGDRGLLARLLRR